MEAPHDGPDLNATQTVNFDKKDEPAATTTDNTAAAETTAEPANNDGVEMEGGDEDSLDGETEHNLAPQIVRLFFRRDQRCEIDLPHAVDTLNFIYVDIDLSFVRTGSTQFRKYEPLLLKRMHVSHRDVHDKEVQAQILREIVQRDADLGRLNSQQVVLTLKKDKRIRRRVLKIAGVRLGGLMNLSKALKGLGIEMSAKELENEEADEYKDSPEYKFIKGNQYDRDRIIDQLMM